MGNPGLPESAVAFIMMEGKVLSVSRKGDGMQFGLPGGKIEPGETPRRACAREVLEETSLVISGLDLLYEGVSKNYYVYCFTPKSVYGTPVDQGVGACNWIEPERLLLGPFRDFAERVLIAWKMQNSQQAPT